MDRNIATGQCALPDNVTFQDLDSIVASLNILFDALAFDVEYIMLPLSYSDRVIHSAGGDSRSDIEKILDCIAMQSTFLNQPEDLSKHSSEIWQLVRNDLSRKFYSIGNRITPRAHTAQR